VTVSEGILGEPHPELLRRYCEQWGSPTDDVPVSDGDGDGFRILVFAGAADPVVRFVTLGLGTCPAWNDASLDVELLLTLDPSEVTAIGVPAVTRFVGEIAEHLLAHAIRPVEGSVLPPIGLAPWEPKAILFDLPRGEAPELEHFRADGHPVRLVWAVPVYASEAELVARDGLAALDFLVEISQCSLAAVRRRPLG
jgi:hypothetical protein